MDCCCRQCGPVCACDMQIALIALIVVGCSAMIRQAAISVLLWRLQFVLWPDPACVLAGMLCVVLSSSRAGFKRVHNLSLRWAPMSGRDPVMLAVMGSYPCTDVIPTSEPPEATNRGPSSRQPPRLHRSQVNLPARSYLIPTPPSPPNPPPSPPRPPPPPPPKPPTG